MAWNEGKGINMKFPVRSYRKGFFETNSTKLDALREDIKILLLTRKGERLMNPRLGTSITTFAAVLFDQISKDEMKLRIQNEITAALRAFMPNVILASLELFTYQDKDKNIPYSIRENDIVLRMSFVALNDKALGEIPLTTVLSN
jgi:phage baseplate assembly protein W